MGPPGSGVSTLLGTLIKTTTDAHLVPPLSTHVSPPRMEKSFLDLPGIFCAKPPCHFHPQAVKQLAVKAASLLGP